MSRLEFNPVEALESIERSGYYHVSKDFNRFTLEVFAKMHGLAIQEGAEFTVTLAPAGTQNGGRSSEEWERIRKDAADKRLKAAAAKKRRQA